jgi:hypothetical protein
MFRGAGVYCVMVHHISAGVYCVMIHHIMHHWCEMGFSSQSQNSKACLTNIRVLELADGADEEASFDYTIFGVHCK